MARDGIEPLTREFSFRKQSQSLVCPGSQLPRNLFNQARNLFNQERLFYVWGVSNYLLVSRSVKRLRNNKPAEMLFHLPRALGDRAGPRRIRWLPFPDAILFEVKLFPKLPISPSPLDSAKQHISTEAQLRRRIGCAESRDTAGFH